MSCSVPRSMGTVSILDSILEPDPSIDKNNNMAPNVSHFGQYNPTVSQCMGQEGPGKSALASKI